MCPHAAARCSSMLKENLEVLNTLKRFLREEEGLEMLEWAIVAALFATAGAVMWLTLGSTVTAELTVIDTSLTGSASAF